jgi:3-isopropylmalate dehydrogenase
MAEVRRVIDWYGANRGLDFAVEEDLVGGTAYDIQSAGSRCGSAGRPRPHPAACHGSAGGDPLRA